MFISSLFVCKGYFGEGNSTKLLFLFIVTHRVVCLILWSATKYLQMNEKSLKCALQFAIEHRNNEVMFIHWIPQCSTWVTPLFYKLHLID